VRQGNGDVTEPNDGNKEHDKGGGGIDFKKSGESPGEKKRLYSAQTWGRSSEKGRVQSMRLHLRSNSSTEFGKRGEKRTKNEPLILKGNIRSHLDGGAWGKGVKGNGPGTNRFLPTGRRKDPSRRVKPIQSFDRIEGGGILVKKR